MKFLAALLLTLSLSSEANECASDAKKFCSSVEPGKGQLAKCLNDVKDQLSPNCSKELKEFKSKTGAKNPCYEDLAEFCVDIPTDNRKLEYCLLKYENKLGATCSADFKKKKGNLVVKDVCAQDIVNNCYSEVSGPEGAINKCLIQNRAKVSKFCQNLVDKKVAEMKKKNPCFTDTEKHCTKQVSFIDIQDCLEKKIPTLAPECKKLVEVEKKRGEANPCYKDLRRHCKAGITASDQHRCLTINEKDISNACKQYRVKEDQKVKKMVELCEADRLKLCPKAPFQNGEIVKCLKENKAKVTKGCADLLN